MYEAIIETHQSQNYGSYSTGDVIDRIIAQYPLFPNEALYAIDCQQTQVEPLSRNFEAIIGIDCPHKNDLMVLYEHVDKQNTHALIQWVEAAVECGFDPMSCIELKHDVCKCIYLTNKKRVLLKCTAGFARDTNGAVRYCIGKLVDLTDLVPFRHFTYTFLGPNRHQFLQRYHSKLDNGFQLLSLRELQVLKYTGQGKTSQQIAKSLFLSKLTVDKHRRNIIRKLGVRNTQEAYLMAINCGLFRPEVLVL